jgi:hypothetical protein
MKIADDITQLIGHTPRGMAEPGHRGLPRPHCGQVGEL